MASMGLGCLPVFVCYSQETAFTPLAPERVPQSEYVCDCHTSPHHSGSSSPRHWALRLKKELLHQELVPDAHSVPSVPGCFPTTAPSVSLIVCSCLWCRCCRTRPTQRSRRCHRIFSPSSQMLLPGVPYWPVSQKGCQNHQDHQQLQKGRASTLLVIRRQVVLLILRFSQWISEGGSSRKNICLARSMANSHLFQTTHWRDTGGPNRENRSLFTVDD